MRVPFLLLLTLPVSAQSLQLELRSIELLGDQASDQNGDPFTVGGLSGVDRTHGGALIAALDNSDHVVEIAYSLGADGALTSAALGPGLTLADSFDFEGVAVAPDGSLWLSEEDSPGLRRYDAALGLLLETPAVPPEFAAKRDNRGFESLAYGCALECLWTANEEALTVDGPEATPANGSVVRLLRYDLLGGAPVAAEQYAYVVEPMHGPYLPGPVGQSGLVDLVVLPDGGVLALERSLALAAPLLLARIYAVDLTGATDVAGLPALDGASYTPVGKHLLWQGSASNLEGLCLGPPLTGGGRALFGVIDDGDPLSLNALVSFQLTGLAAGACGCLPAPYCATSPNSVGAGARIGWQGSASLAADDLTLTVTAAPPGTLGLFVHAPERGDQPVGDGTLCLGGGLVRLPVVQVDGAGDVSHPLDLAALGVAVGETRRFQMWYRDPGFGAGSNLSDALEVRFCP